MISNVPPSDWFLTSQTYPVNTPHRVTNIYSNKKVLLRERKRHTDRSVSSTPSAGLSRGVPTSAGGGGHLHWGTPGQGRYPPSPIKVGTPLAKVGPLSPPQIGTPIHNRNPPSQGRYLPWPR